MNNQDHTSAASSDAATSSLSRRAMLKSTGIAAAGVMLGSALANAQTAPAAAPANPTAANLSDLDILNFALSLEHLDFTFFTRVVEADTQRQYLHGRLHQIAPAMRDNEAAHVQAISSLITSLGGTPVAVGTYVFPADVFISPLSFTHFAYTLKEIGIGAYLGAIGKIRSKDVRRAAASIYGNETRQAALLRHLGGFQFSPRYYEGPLTMAQTQQLIDPYVR